MDHLCNVYFSGNPPRTGLKIKFKIRNRGSVQESADRVKGKPCFILAHCKKRCVPIETWNVRSYVKYIFYSPTEYKTIEIPERLRYVEVFGATIVEYQQKAPTAAATSSASSATASTTATAATAFVFAITDAYFDVSASSFIGARNQWLVLRNIFFLCFVLDMDMSYKLGARSGVNAPPLSMAPINQVADTVLANIEPKNKKKSPTT